METKDLLLCSQDPVTSSYTGKGKNSKVVCVNAMKAYRGSGGIAPFMLLLALDGVVSLMPQLVYP
jgi:hypothetical protein